MLNFKYYKLRGKMNEKIINILLIAILSITFIGLALFVVNFAKDTFINDNTKADTVSKNRVKIKKKNKVLNQIQKRYKRLKKIQVTLL